MSRIISIVGSSPCQPFAATRKQPYYHVYQKGSLVHYGTLGACLRWVAGMMGDPAGVVTVKEALAAGFSVKAYQ